MSEIWLRMHTRTHAKIETKSISPRCGLSPTGAKNVLKCASMIVKDFCQTCIPPLHEENLDTVGFHLPDHIFCAKSTLQCCLAVNKAN